MNKTESLAELERLAKAVIAGGKVLQIGIEQHRPDLVKTGIAMLEESNRKLGDSLDRCETFMPYKHISIPTLAGIFGREKAGTFCDVVFKAAFDLLVLVRSLSKFDDVDESIFSEAANLLAECEPGVVAEIGFAKSVITNPLFFKRMGLTGEFDN